MTTCHLLFDLAAGGGKPSVCVCCTLRSMLDVDGRDDLRCFCRRWCFEHSLPARPSSISYLSAVIYEVALLLLRSKHQTPKAKIVQRIPAAIPRPIIVGETGTVVIFSGVNYVNRVIPANKSARRSPRSSRDRRDQLFQCQRRILQLLLQKLSASNLRFRRDETPLTQQTQLGQQFEYDHLEQKW